jgi:hypothetical protein
MRTARSITSGENFGDFLMLAPFSIEGASSKGGAVHDCFERLGLHRLRGTIRYPGKHNSWRRETA